MAVWWTQMLLDSMIYWDFFSLLSVLILFYLAWWPSFILFDFFSSLLPTLFVIPGWTFGWHASKGQCTAHYPWDVQIFAPLQPLTQWTWAVAQGGAAKGRGREAEGVKLVHSGCCRWLEVHRKRAFFHLLSIQCWVIRKNGNFQYWTEECEWDEYGIWVCNVAYIHLCDCMALRFVSDVGLFT